MNRQVFTLMTVFLMLGALWNGAWGATTITIENVSTSKINQSLDDGQYYLIGTGNPGSFLVGKELPMDSGEKCTILDNSKNSFTDEDNIELALWQIEDIKIDGNIIGCYLKNKATNSRLTFTTNGEIPTANSTSLTTQFLWFPSNKYQGNDKSMKIQLLTKSDKAIDAADKISDFANADNFNVYTIETDKMTAEQLNKRMGNGFILAAKGISKVEETPLLNHKLVAITFSKASDASFTNSTQVENIINDDDKSKIFFIYSGFENFEKDGIDLANFNVTIDQYNEEKVLEAFKATTFVAASNSIILDYTTIFTTPGYGYTFTTKTGEELLKNSSVSHLNAKFQVSYNPSQGTAATVNDLSISLKHSKFKDVSVKVSPYVIRFEDKYYLVTAPDKSTTLGFASSGGAINFNHFKGNAYSITIADKEVEVGEDGENNTIIWNAIDYTKLNLIDRTIHPSSNGKFIEGENDQQEPIYTYISDIQFCEPNEFLANKPEGQWMVTEKETPKCLFLNNRESGEQFKIGNKDHGYILYKVNDANNLYYIPGGLTGSYNGQKIRIDTLRFEKQNTSGLDGYAHCKNPGDAFDPVVLKNTAYKLGIQNGTFDNSIVFVQKSSTHNNTLVVDVKTDEGLSFYLVPYDTVSYGITTPDKGYYNETKKTQPIDNLIRIQYALQERTSKRYVIYDSDNSRFMLAKDSENVDKALEDAQKFYFKEKEEGQYILLPAEGWYRKKDDTFEWIDRTTEKVYANIGDAFLHKIEMYKKDIADKFGFYSTAAPMYADIMKKLKGNTPGNNDTTLFKINLYSVQNRSGNQKYMLAAGQHNFLTEGIPDTRSDIIINSKAIGGLAYDSIKFSIIVDTAYVRRTPMNFDEYGNPTLDGKPDSSSVMPLYYLGMSSLDPKENVTQDTIGPLHPWDTDYLGHKIECQHYTIKSSGNYLFAMTDSIEHGLDNIVKREDHCYHYWNTHHPRLRFVHATHEEDTMIVTSIHGSPKDTLIGGKITTTIEAMKETEWLAPQIYDENAPDNRPNYGLFAFEVNPNPFDPEVPEYALWNPASKKYIAYVNGNLIMEDQPSYYTLDIKSEGHSIVSNEMVRTSDVRVVAAQGKVIIQNAAGKKVFLQTALGKTLADTVLTSDQEEMAAPAGIVFVTVEGEETVKTIVK